VQKSTPSPRRMHQTPARKLIWSLVAAAAVSGCTAGCTAAGQAPTRSPRTCADDVTQASSTPVIAATATSAEPAPALPAMLRNALRERARAGRSACVAITTQRGLIGLDVTPRRPGGQVENGPARPVEVERNLDAVSARLATLAESRDGLDPLRVIDAATRLHPRAGTLYVVTSGVATVTPTDLRTLGWDLDADDQAVRLARAREIPSLVGWRVRFVGIGDVAGPQPVPGIALRERLRQWWTAICHAGRAASCDADTELLRAGPPASRNGVPIVPLPQPHITHRALILPNALLFPIRSAHLGDGADGELRAVVERVLKTKEFVRITGHTDAITGTEAGNLRLSGQRATAVAERLVSLGLPQARIDRVEGVGDGGASRARELADPGQVAADRNVRIGFVRNRHAWGNEYRDE
jgi:outer membrane protein OmpA-like peptidoglycan-associated protein